MKLISKEKKILGKCPFKHFMTFICKTCKCEKCDFYDICACEKKGKKNN